jgi:hypothetical protein
MNNVLVLKTNFLIKFENVSIEKLNLDSGVVKILNSRLKEINQNIKTGAALSVIIMCGSVLGDFSRYCNFQNERV